MTTREEKGYAYMLETLYHQHRGRMYHRALGILGDHGLAEDALHEAFIRMARHLSRFEDMSDEERRYLCLTIVKNAALNMLRDRGRTDTLPEGMTAKPVDIPLRVDLTNALDALEDDHRQVVLLRLRYGFDTTETAHLLGIKQGTVRSRLSRAKKILRDILSDGNAAGKDRTIQRTGVKNDEVV